MNKLLRCAAVAAALSISASVSADWSISGLNSMYGVSASALDINDSGQMVGSFRFDANNTHAFITGANGVGLTDLGAGDGLNSYASGINNFGQVVGTIDNNQKGFVTDANGQNIKILTDHIPTAINDSGQYIAGNVFFNGNSIIPLETLGGITSGARGLNNSGQLVGESSTSGLFGGMFITGDNGIGIRDIGTLGGIVNNQANAINEIGQIAGVSNYKVDDSGSAPHAFVTGADGFDMIDLGTFGGYYSSARDINNHGEVVGRATIALDDSTQHGFIYSHGGMTDLTLLETVLSNGWTEIDPIAINNNGQIVGSGIHNGQREGFLLSYTEDTIFNPNPIFIPPPVSPIPEPTTWAMLLAGLGLLGFVGRRSKLA